MDSAILCSIMLATISAANRMLTLQFSAYVPYLSSLVQRGNEAQHLTLIPTLVTVARVLAAANHDMT